ncbi:hypothetical protein MESS2_780014 [Mesorhizobium metallidurans STM 2683]|uniref:Uncharacterized protein n=1 Tax=Mesorhizobium metallidurans STM 2683 TaxID=1297569 RepID=M5EWP2_9HYPH|nr:hypothetical protein MESS2_780014 [Mesorhizobium metallidurans STM 2683]
MRQLACWRSAARQRLEGFGGVFQDAHRLGLLFFGRIDDVAERRAQAVAHSTEFVALFRTAAATPPAILAVVVPAEPVARLGHLAAETLEVVEHVVDHLAVFVEMRLPGIGDREHLLVAFRRRDGIAGLFQEGQRRIDHAWTWAVDAAGALLQRLDDVIAVARRLGQQRQRNQLEIAVGQHPPGAEHVARPAASAATTAMAERAEAAATTAEPAGHMHEGAQGVLAEMMMPEIIMFVHRFLLSYVLRYILVRQTGRVSQDISYDVSGTAPAGLTC